MFQTTIRISTAGAALLAIAMVLALSPAVADANHNLTDREQRCSSTFIKGSTRVLQTVGKSARTCTKNLGSTGGGGGEDVADCVMTDAKNKLGKAEDNVTAGILKHCSVPYAMSCPAPCETVDDGGATTGIDDDAELIDCLFCFNVGTAWSGSASTPLLQGVFGAIQNGATIATGKEGIRCQSAVLKGTGRLFDTKIRLAAKCIKPAFAVSSTPPEGCITALVTSGKFAAKIAKALGKLGNAAANKCPTAPPFDGGQCAGLGGTALADCIDVIVDCRACRWINAVIGGRSDCDASDDGVVNGSCALPPPAVCGDDSAVACNAYRGGKFCTKCCVDDESCAAACAVVHLDACANPLDNQACADALDAAGCAVACCP